MIYSGTIKINDSSLRKNKIDNLDISLQEKCLLATKKFLTDPKSLLKKSYL